MGQKNLFWLVLMIPILISCKSEQENLWEWENVKIEEKTCAKENCATISLTNPKVKETSEIQKHINHQIESKAANLLDFWVEEGDQKSIRDNIEKFLSEFREFLELSDYSQDWQIEVNVNVNFENQSLLSLVFDSYNYTGGAHPNSFRSFQNFDKISGQLIKNEDLITDEVGLLKLAEKYFRDYHEVPEDFTLAEDDRFFLLNDTEFFLPAAIGIDKKGLILFYNSYEIGPYVLGATELIIPNSEIRGLVDFERKDQ